MNQYNFMERLRFSSGVVAATVPETVSRMIPGSVRVEQASEIDDREGIDYIATLDSGVRVFVDVKCRDRGCSKFWRPNQLDIALETWSAIPVNGSPGRVGWTLDRAKKTHYTLHVFHPEDTTRCFLLPFQILRAAFEKNRASWSRTYRTARQCSGSWRSECVFVPIDVIFRAVSAAMETEGELPPDTEDLGF